MPSDQDNGVWPHGVREDVKELITLYFQLVDSKHPSAGPRLADEVFAKDGRWFAAAGCFEGHGKSLITLCYCNFWRGGFRLLEKPDSIAESRRNAWDKIDSQVHEATKVYLNDVHGFDLLIVGSARIELKDSVPMTPEFLVRAAITLADGQPKIKFWQPVLVKPDPSEQPILEHVEL